MRKLFTIALCLFMLVAYAQKDIKVTGNCKPATNMRTADKPEQSLQPHKQYPGSPGNALGLQKGGPSGIHFGACLHTTAETTGVRIDEPFAMHSIMKFPQALFVAECLTRQNIPLSETVTVRKEELMQNTWSPMLRMFDNDSVFSYADLLRLSLQQSDNNACDILFKRFGGPEKVEEFLYQLGFKGIHIRWTEQEMCIDYARSADNNCTPKALALLLEWFYRHKEHNEYLHFVWKTMASCQTGTGRIASIIPEGSVFVHKTGTGFPSKDKRQDRNDAGIIIMPDGTYQILTVFVPQSTKEEDVAIIGKKFIKR